MDSITKAQSLFFLAVSIFVSVQIHVVYANKFDSLTQKVTFYPGSVLISHSPKPLAFYEDTKLLNVHTVFNFTEFGRSFAMNNWSCSPPMGKFYDQLLLTIRSFQKVIRRLLSLPGFSTLVESDTYLPRYFQFMVGQVSRMSCPRAYKSSISECKTWALQFCHGMSMDERQWLLGNRRVRRSNCMCHAGGLRLFRAIYTATGHKCEENHVKNLKASLRTPSRAMSISQSMMRIINGKVVYLFKITDQIGSKLNVLAKDLKIVDDTFSVWQTQLKRFANTVRSHEGLTMEFLSKYTAGLSRAFVAFFRLFEIQDTFSLVTCVRNRQMGLYSDLPKFVASHLSAKLVVDPSLKLTVSALEEGLSVLASPLVDVEHDGRNLTVDILLLAPVVRDQNDFSIVERLTSLKFNISGKCFTGPVQHTNLALISCPKSKQVVSFKALDRCFSSEVGFLCPKNVLKSVSSLQWLGFAWNPDLKLSFPGNHQPAPDCDHIHPLIHLGGRYFLSATSGTLTLNTSGLLSVSTLAVYNFPCNVSFVGMKASLATCPERLLMSTSTITYVQWDPSSEDLIPLQLHHESLAIPPPVKINRTLINDLDEKFQLYDNQLSAVRREADSLIDQIEETFDSSYVEYVAFTALGLSITNFIVFCVLCRCIFRYSVPRSHHSPLQPPPQPLPEPEPSSRQHKTCHRCAKPEKKRTPSEVKERVAVAER